MAASISVPTIRSEHSAAVPLNVCLVLAVMAFPVHIVKDCFRRYELPALGCALALSLVLTFTGIPAGPGNTLILATLVLRRAGSWWAPAMQAAGAYAAAWPTPDR